MPRIPIPVFPKEHPAWSPNFGYLSKKRVMFTPGYGWTTMVYQVEVFNDKRQVITDALFTTEKLAQDYADRNNGKVSMRSIAFKEK